MTSAPNFAEATGITALDANTYTGNFPAQYCIGSVPHGGFVASCILHVAQKHLGARGQPDTVIAHIEYLNRTEIGPTVFVVEEAKLGQRTSVVHVTLYQHALECDRAPWITPGRSRKEVVAYVTNTDLARESGLTLPTEYVLPTPAPPPAPVDLARLGREGRDEHWQRFRPGGAGGGTGNYRAVMDQSEFYVPRRGVVQRSIVDMWVRLATGERFTNMLLGFVADMWPYVVESYRPASDAASATEKPLFDRRQVFWYPTLALSLDVKQALPPDGVEWLFLRVASKQIRHGRLDLEVVILDAQDRLVALSHHVSLIMDASRNLSERSHRL